MEQPLAEIDDGWDFKVLVVGGEWVVRWPRHRLAVEEIEKEAELLPALAPLLPVEVPQFEYVSREPWLVVYRFIQGRPLVDEDSGGVRAFLDALHGIDIDAIPAPRPDWLETYREQADEFRRLVLPLLDPDEHAAGEALLQEVETLTGFAPALTHSDLGPSHLLVRDGKLAGVIDWGDARIGDPALDYAWLLHVPFPNWDVDAELRRRARLPPPRAVVRGALRRLHRAAAVGALRPRRDQAETLTSPCENRPRWSRGTQSRSGSSGASSRRGSANP